MIYQVVMTSGPIRFDGNFSVSKCKIVIALIKRNANLFNFYFTANRIEKY